MSGERARPIINIHKLKMNISLGMFRGFSAQDGSNRGPAQRAEAIFKFGIDKLLLVSAAGLREISGFVARAYRAD